MPRYAVCFSKTGADSVRQLVDIMTGAGNNRQQIYFFSVGCVSTPTDAFFKYVVRRVTGNASGPGIDPMPLDPTDSPNFNCDIDHLITADHASFATGPEVFRVPCHHRAVCIFAAASGQELVSTSVNGEGISLGLADVSTNQFKGTVMRLE